ncbi:NnrU family protein [Yoonia sediminilitoris]|uniref:NnrU protein n=1 Tax=Yoonia sediminilitoris TaxID=1286148 RepID=A0A2T6KKE0_9RHOB|nr:NnrU family protein [Yoonia sediminilitoris]PUB16392.1 NnrU protein [Yoonia sediminilitoris]RCW96741.1 NnrU protein [Yoonia sediminilitoris]
MTLLISGVALWWAAHLFKRLLPGVRAGLGTAGYPVMAVLIILSIVLMVLGYRSADGAFYWGRSPAMVGINNLLMIVAFYFYAASAAKGAKIWLGTKVRHPQLTGFSIWAVSHLLVNGDSPSFILFGGLLIWAIVEILIINAQEGPWQRPPRAPVKKEITAVVVTIVVVVVVMGIHYALGVPPWG